MGKKFYLLLLIIYECPQVFKNLYSTFQWRIFLSNINFCDLRVICSFYLFFFPLFVDHNDVHLCFLTRFNSMLISANLRSSRGSGRVIFLEEQGFVGYEHRDCSHHSDRLKVKIDFENIDRMMRIWFCLTHDVMLRSIYRGNMVESLMFSIIIFKSDEVEYRQIRRNTTM